MKINRIDHVSIKVNNFSEAKAFFLDLGLEVQAEWDWRENSWTGKKSNYTPSKHSSANF